MAIILIVLGTVLSLLVMQFTSAVISRSVKCELMERKTQSFGVYEILCVNGFLSLGESPLKHNGKSIERRLPITDRHSPLLSDIL